MCGPGRGSKKNPGVYLGISHPNLNNHQINPNIAPRARGSNAYTACQYPLVSTVELSSRTLGFTYASQHLFENFGQVEFAGVDDDGVFGDG